jgi:hypothetical protein
VAQSIPNPLLNRVNLAASSKILAQIGKRGMDEVSRAKDAELEREVVIEVLFARPLLIAQHVLEMFRRTLPQRPDRRLLDRLSNRLTKIASEIRIGSSGIRALNPMKPVHPKKRYCRFELVHCILVHSQDCYGQSLMILVLPVYLRDFLAGC